VHITGYIEIPLLRRAHLYKRTYVLETTLRGALGGLEGAGKGKWQSFTWKLARSTVKEAKPIDLAYFWSQEILFY